MYPDPENTGSNANNSTGSVKNLPPGVAQLVGVLLESGQNIFGGGSPSAPFSNPLAVPEGALPTNLAPWLQDLFYQDSGITGNTNIPPISGRGGGLINKQGSFDAHVAQMIFGTHDVGNVGDPSGGKIPGYGHPSDPTIHSDQVGEAISGALMNAYARQMELAEMRAHDPYRNDPLHYAPIDPGIWGDLTQEQKDEANKLLSGLLGALLGTVVGAVGGAIGGSKVPGGSATTVIVGAVAGFIFGYSFPKKWLFPDPDDGGGIGGPRSNPGFNPGTFPDPEGGWGGPRGAGSMPSPDDSGGGNPRSMSARTQEWFPDPEGSGSGGPKG